jgi:hypothetical protein
MQTFKLTPKPQSDYRVEVKEIKKRCQIEKHGYRHDKIIYGFCDELLDIIELQSLGFNIEEITFDEAQLNLTNYLVERRRVKSKIDHLQYEQDENGTTNKQEEAEAQQKLKNLNNNIQVIKEALGITGTLKTLKL